MLKGQVIKFAVQFGTVRNPHPNENMGSFLSVFG